MYVSDTRAGTPPTGTVSSFLMQKMAGFCPATAGGTGMATAKMR